MTDADRVEAPGAPPALRLTRSQWLLVAALSIIVAAGCREMHLNADSLHYIDMARTWIADRTIATWHLTLNAEHVPAVEMLWPPVYGILLAGPLALGLSPNAAPYEKGGPSGHMQQ